MASSTGTREEHQIGYTTDFCGEWTVTPPLTPERIAYLTKFSETRRIKRDPRIAENLYDPIRAAVGLPVGPDGGYYTGAEGFHGQNTDASIINGNGPPDGQPGLWCQWIPSADGKEIAWDGGEKFYEYEEWIRYLIDYFLRPWGHVLNGDVEWQGENSDDRGVIRITDNGVEFGVNIPGYLFPKGANMPASNTKTITATISAPVPAGGTVLPAAVPAAVLSRKPQATGTQPKNVHNFAAWKDAIGTAQSATGYDTTSPIYGKTDIEVLTLIRPFLADAIELLGAELPAGTYTLSGGRDIEASVSWANAKQALSDIDEMVKRKVAKQIAGQTYKSRKTI